MKKIYIQILIIISLAFGQDEPSMFNYNQSTLQGFYFFDAVLINNIQIDEDDWVGAFKNNLCVGARKWDTSICGGGICDVPVMGDDGSDYTLGYMLPGETPTFKIYDASENIYYDAQTQNETCQWIDQEHESILRLMTMTNSRCRSTDLALNRFVTRTKCDSTMDCRRLQLEMS